jgi:hypothetical protein
MGLPEYTFAIPRAILAGVEGIRVDRNREMLRVNKLADCQSAARQIINLRYGSYHF